MDPLTLPTLLKRLEAATSRLEDIAMAQAASGGTASHGAATSHPLLAPAPPAAAFVTPSAQVSPAVAKFEDLLDGPLENYLKLSNVLGGLVSEQALAVGQAFVAQKEFITFASQCTKLSSSSPAFAERLGPTQSALVASIEIKEKNRASKEANLLSTVSEGIPALGWVTLDQKPGPYVGDMKESAQFWANRVVKDNKESNPKVVEWARSFITLVEELRKYVMEYHTTGLSWNLKGIDPITYQSTTTSSTAPPPPPPPPAPPASGPPPTHRLPAPPAAGDMANVFASLNKGEAITKGLKKVDKSEMTHKNPELRASSVVEATIPSTPSKGPVKPPKPHSFQKKPPKTFLDGTKWIIENHENNPSIVIGQTEINQLVDVFNVRNSVIQINGKVNAISMVNCSKVSILLESTVSSLAISNSPSFTVQITGKVPTILVDGTDGGQIYLSASSLDVEIVTAKSSAINVSLPVEGEEDGIYTEKAVPEQLKTVVMNGKLVTTVVEHSG